MANTALNPHALLADAPPGPLWVGFSGGMDSSVLLHLLAHADAHRTHALTALHVCHGLHPQAHTWAQHCAAFAAALGVPFLRVDASVETIRHEGVEAAARRARYRAFAQHLPCPAVLTLAHHQDDQAETLLLRLLHGAGQEGLAGMRKLRPLQGHDARRLLWRPLLDVPHRALVEYAQHHRLAYITDPSNADSRYLRNHLRHSVLPAMQQAFPDAAARIAATASRLREEADALDDIARSLLHQHLDRHDNSLACQPLRVTPPALARRLVGLWLDHLGLPRPPPGIWTRLLPDLVNARQDATPALAWQGARLRRYRSRLHGDTGLASAHKDWLLPWDGCTPLPLPDGLGTLAFAPALRQPGNFHVRPRRGGESLLLNGHHRSVKKLLQEVGIPPWQRDTLPLLFDTDERLLSIAARWHDDDFAQQLANSATRLTLQH